MVICNEIVMSENPQNPPTAIVVNSTKEDLITLRQNGNKITLDQTMVENLFELLSIKGLIK